MKPMASAGGARRAPALAEDAAVAPGFLGLVERAIRAVEGGIRGVFGDEVGDAAGCGDGHRLVVEVKAELGDLDADLVRYGMRFGRRRAHEQHDEFLAPVARYEVRLAHVRGELLAEYAQHLVAGFVPVGVVDALEAVDVPREDAHRAPKALPAPEFLFDALI